MPATERPQAAILVLHGDVDPFVPDPVVNNFLKEMREVDADFQFVRFSGAVHSFSNPNANWAGKAEYHKPSAVRSWAMTTEFLDSVLQIRSEQPADPN
jgi:dienelactone hydrolase